MAGFGIERNKVIVIDDDEVLGSCQAPTDPNITSDVTIGSCSQLRPKSSRSSTQTLAGDQTYPSTHKLVIRGSPSTPGSRHPEPVDPFNSAIPQPVIEIEDEDGVIICPDDYLTKEEFQRFMNNPQPADREPTPPPHPRRNEPPESPWVEADSCDFASMKILPGKTVELDDDYFLRVTTILKHLASDEVMLRGWRLRRTRAMQGMLAGKRNELCMLLDLDEDDERDGLVQGAEEVFLSEVRRIRRVIFTNQNYPAQSFRETEKTGAKTPDDIVFNQCHLVCRWVHITSYRTARDRNKNKNNWTEKQLVKLRQNDQGVDSDVTDEELRHCWRGETVKGGSGRLQKGTKEEQNRSRRPGKDVIDLTESKSSMTSRKRSRSSTPKERTTTDLGGDTDKEDYNRLRKPEKDVIDLTNPTSATTDLCGDTDSEIDLTVESDASASLCLSPSIDARRRHSARSNGQSFNTSKHEVKADIVVDVDQEPRIKFDLTATHNERPTKTAQSTSAERAHSKKRVAGGHHVEATFASESRTPRSWTRCTGKITSWTSDENPTKKPKLNTTQCPTPPDSSNSLRSSRSKSGKGLLNVAAIPFSLGSSRNSTRTNTALPVAVDKSLGSEHVDLRRPFTCPAYSIGDCFCGAGGMSCAARLAGFDIRWAFDHDVAATSAYKLNHPGTECYLSEVDQFMPLDEGDKFKVEVMHLSPPCQFFSAAHTMNGKNDDQNTAAQTAVPELIRKCRPRIVTLEQTNGLIQRHQDWFRHMIQFFTDLGFSVRWKVVNFAEYGLPQARRRLMIFASCPGEVLPPFPKPTHSGDAERRARYRLARLTTVNDAIGNIPPDAPNHDPDHAPRLNARPYPGDLPLPHCITTSGGGNKHPDGTRPFTLREFACLQGFPMNYKFGATCVLRQIGNAVPPSVGKLFLAEIRKALLKADGLLPSDEHVECF